MHVCAYANDNEHRNVNVKVAWRKHGSNWIKLKTLQHNADQHESDSIGFSAGSRRSTTSTYIRNKKLNLGMHELFNASWCRDGDREPL